MFAALPGNSGREQDEITMTAQVVNKDLGAVGRNVLCHFQTLHEVEFAF